MALGEREGIPPRSRGPWSAAPCHPDGNIRGAVLPLPHHKLYLPFSAPGLTQGQTRCWRDFHWGRRGRVIFHAFTTALQSLLSRTVHSPSLHSHPSFIQCSPHTIYPSHPRSSSGSYSCHIRSYYLLNQTLLFHFLLNTSNFTLPVLLFLAIPSRHQSSCALLNISLCPYESPHRYCTKIKTKQQLISTYAIIKSTKLRVLCDTYNDMIIQYSQSIFLLKIWDNGISKHPPVLCSEQLILLIFLLSKMVRTPGVKSGHLISRELLLTKVLKIWMCFGNDGWIWEGRADSGNDAIFCHINNKNKVLVLYMKA